MYYLLYIFSVLNILLYTVYFYFYHSLLSDYYNIVIYKNTRVSIYIKQPFTYFLKREYFHYPKIL